MKKLPLFCILYFVFCIFSEALAYTSTDVSNATFLVNENLIVKQSTSVSYRLDDTITRAEVVGIALKIKGVTLPENYQCKGYFSDVRNHDWICRAVELAADTGIVSRANIKARPQDTITRAEALAIIVNASNIQFPQSAETVASNNDGIGDWQKKIISKAFSRGLWSGNKSSIAYERPLYTLIFSPSQSALRGEVFQLVYNIVNLQYLDKNPLAINFSQLNTEFPKVNSTNFFIISALSQKPCIDPKDDFRMGYGPSEESVCGTKEYKIVNTVFLRSLSAFKSGQYIENIGIVCENCFGDPGSVVIAKNHIFAIRPDFGGGAATFLEIVVQNNVIAARELGHTNFVATEDPVIDEATGWDTNEFKFYKKVLDSLLLQK